MKIVIEIITDITGPKRKKGSAMYTMQAIDDKGQGLRAVSEKQEICASRYEAAVDALYRAAKRIKSDVPADIVIKTDVVQLFSGIYSMQAWEKNNWRNSKGRAVAMQDQWKTIRAALSGRIVTTQKK